MRQAGTVLDSMGKPKINFYLTLSAAVVNVVSNVVFIHFYGPIGAAYGTLVSYLIIIIVNQIFLRKFLDVSFMNILYSLFSYYKTGVMFSWRIITR
jgi:O-antigen/teichoic acid export membrane protein